MPKKLDPTKHDLGEFQPIEKAFVNAVLEEGHAEESSNGAAAAVDQRPPKHTRHNGGGRPHPRPTVLETTVQEREAPAASPQRRPAVQEEQLPVSESRERAPMQERFTRPLKAMVSKSEEAEVGRIVNLLRRELGTSVSTTNLLRAMVTILRHSEKAVLRRAEQGGSVKRPANEDLTGIAVFEFKLAKILFAAFRDAPPLREG
ncbi:MAG: hypothetical protein IT349_20565 [Candidatus Eisenbacteria bacterium]|nr:hypothetical protein [Candidatus Eisenbacteria bacterium]